MAPSTLGNVANSNFNSSFAKKIAQTNNLACSVGGAQMLTIGADGYDSVVGALKEDNSAVGCCLPVIGE